MRPDTGAASAMSLAGFDVTRFIAFTSGTSRFTPNIFMTSPAWAPAALIVTRARTSISWPVNTSRTRMPAIWVESFNAEIACA